MTERSQHPDWTRIRQEYIENPALSHRTIAEKYGVTQDAVRGHASRDRWARARAEFAQQRAQRLTELSLAKDAPALIRECNDEWLKQSKELRYMLSTKLKMRTADGQVIPRPDVSVHEIVRAIAGFAELYRMDRLALGASTDNLSPAFPENKYDEMTEDELIDELRRVRATTTIN